MMMMQADQDRQHDARVRGKLGELVADRLRQAILSGKLAPGQGLPEKLLATEMDVSRGPVRQALEQLEREGLVITPRNHTAYVARLSPNDVEEISSLRLALFRMAVPLAVRNATAEELARMKAVANEMLARQKAGAAPLQLVDLHRRLSGIIYEATHHRRLMECLALLQPQLDMLFLNHLVADPQFCQRAGEYHMGFIDLIVQRDEAAALREVERSFVLSNERIISAYHKDALSAQN
jgi:DNA-binding GntR family transcriptional regulator